MRSRRALLAGILFVSACGASGAPAPTTAPRPAVAPEAASARGPDVREFFPFGGYIGGGGWADHEIAARDGGFPSVEAYMDGVTASMEQGGFNVVRVNNMPQDTADYEMTLRAWLDAGGRHGVRVIPQGGVEPRYFPDKEVRTRVEGEIKPFGCGYFSSRRKSMGVRGSRTTWRGGVGLLVWGFGQ